MARTRYTIAVAPETDQQLKALKKVTATGHVTEVIRKAVRFYHWYKTNVPPDATVTIQTKDGETRIVVFAD